MKIYNTLSRKKEEFKPIEEGKAKIYVCGPTVYNLIHIGNARPLIVFDTFRRYLEYIGYKVDFVQNFTDIDDKIIKKANEELLATGAHYCFERLANGDEQLKIVKQEIEELRISLREKTEWKDDLEESMDSAYSLMHGLLGHDVMNLYDKRKGKE